MAQLLCDAVFLLAMLLEPRFRNVDVWTIECTIESLLADEHSLDQDDHQDHGNDASIVIFFPLRSNLTEYIRGSFSKETFVSALALHEADGTMRMRPDVKTKGVAAFKPCGYHRGCALAAGEPERDALFVSFRIHNDRRRKADYEQAANSVSQLLRERMSVHKKSFDKGYPTVYHPASSKWPL